jgi:cyclic patellamide precursor peptide PatG
MQISDNAGATDEHRTLHYLSVRYSAVHATAAQAYRGDAPLTAVEVRASPPGGARKIADVIFRYTNGTTDVTETLFVRVDVTEAFTFTITRITPYCDR